MVTTKKSAQAAAAAAVLSQLEGADQPVAPIPNGRTGSMDADNEERERVANLYRGIRTLFFETYGYYPKDQILQEEGYKHLASREFGINLMLLGAKRAEATREEKEAAYLGILGDLGIDLTPFKTPTVTGKSRFNWRYYRNLSYAQCVEYRERYDALVQFTQSEQQQVEAKLGKPLSAEQKDLTVAFHLLYHQVDPTEVIKTVWQSPTSQSKLIEGKQAMYDYINETVKAATKAVEKLKIQSQHKKQTKESQLL